MTARDFIRETEADPEKWADAFCQKIAYSVNDPRLPFDRAFVARWFRDAMDAAVKAAQKPDTA
jgi:hypothetical protein